MTTANLALDALNESKVKGDEDTTRILNGIKTCGPAIYSVLSSESTDLANDINNVLLQTKELIDSVGNNIKESGITISPLEQAAINYMCIKVAAMGWEKDQEVDCDEFEEVVVKSIQINGISAEIDNSSFITDDGSAMAASMSAGADVCSAIYGTLAAKQAFPDDLYSFCMKGVYEAVNESIKMLSQLNIRDEDMGKIKPYFVTQAGSILSSIIEREHRTLVYYNRATQLGGVQPAAENSEISYDEVIRHFKLAMRSITRSIINNSTQVR